MPLAPTQVPIMMTKNLIYLIPRTFTSPDQRTVLPTLNFYSRPILNENWTNFKKLGQIAKIGGFWVAVAPLERFF